MNRYEKRVVFYSATAHAVIHMLELSYAAVLVILKVEFNSNLFLLGLVANLAAFAFGAGALPAGVLSDKFGSKRIVMACLATAGVTAVLVAVSPSIYMLAASLTALGLAIGLYHPAGMSFISRGVRQRSLGLGFNGVGGNIGVAFAPVFAASVAALWGWRTSYLILAVLAFIILVTMLRVAPVREEEAPAEIARQAAAPAKADVKVFYFTLIALYISYMFTGLIYRGAVTFLPAYIGERVEFAPLNNLSSVVKGGSFTTIILLFGVFGQYLGGYLSERMPIERLLMPVALGLTPALFLMGATSGLLLVIVAAVFAFCNFMGQPIYSSLIAKYTPHHWQGRSYGISYFATFGGGSFSAGLAGYIAQNQGINWVFFCLAGFGLPLIAVAIYVIWAASARTERTLVAERPGAA